MQKLLVDGVVSSEQYISCPCLTNYTYDSPAKLNKKALYNKPSSLCKDSFSTSLTCSTHR
ncbi:hypothetical protein LguiA_019958 [Lonicera macranthoides]